MDERCDRRDVLKALLAACASPVLAASWPARAQAREATLILRNGNITTLDASKPNASAVAIADGHIVAVGDDALVMQLAGPRTHVIDVEKRRVIPGLMDSHTHLIRGGLSYNMELRWDGVPSLVQAMRMLKDQALRTPPPQWVRVVGGFNEYQFAERRMPTLAEINAAAPDTPVFILRLYDRALLNRAALRAVGITKHSKDPPGSLIERTKSGDPTGLLIAKPNASLLYATLAQGPKLSLEDQMNSTRHFMRELNRLGVTTVMDAGGGFQSYPQDYDVVERLARADQLTVRISYNLFTQKPQEELADLQSWAKIVRPGRGDNMYRHNGAGEMLVYSAADYEDFREPRPELPTTMEAELERVVRHLAQVKWPFRLHATYDETIERALAVFEKVDREVSLTNLHWFFDHAETISPRNIDRVMALGGGIAVQHRMAFQGEDFAERYGHNAMADAPPLKRILAAGVALGAGTDATRVASYNPWVSLYWLVTGNSIGGLTMSQQNRLDRTTALRLWTEANTWFSNEEGKKGAIKVGQLADVAVLSADYMSVADEDIKNLTSALTLLGGNVVHADGPFRKLSPPLPPASPDWSPSNRIASYDHDRRKGDESGAARMGSAPGCNCSFL
jgi:predicted amidohydrolase YtcJ